MKPFYSPNIPKKGMPPAGLPKRESPLKKGLPKTHLEIGGSRWKEGTFQERFEQIRRRQRTEEKKRKTGLLGFLFGSRRRFGKRQKSKVTETVSPFDGKGFVSTERLKERVKKDIGGKIPGFFKGFKTKEKRLAALKVFEGKNYLSRKEVRRTLTRLDKERKALKRKGESLQSKELRYRTKQLEYLKRLTGEKPRKY